MADLRTAERALGEALELVRQARNVDTVCIDGPAAKAEYTRRACVEVLRATAALTGERS